MQIISLSVAAFLVLASVGCATGSGTSNYQQELARLEADCKAKDGILTPSSAPQSSNPASDYGCRIVGPASRLPSSN